jgi:hypothetical protein
MECALQEKDRTYLTVFLNSIIEDMPELEAEIRPIITNLNTCTPCPEKCQTMKITGTAKATDIAKSGRKLSAYQVFMGECMRPPEKGGKGMGMKDCVGDWNAKKKSGGLAVQSTEGQVM